MINAAGGVMINGEPHMIEVIDFDTKGEVADSRAATLRLVEQDKVKYVYSQAAASNVGMLQALLQKSSGAGIHEANPVD